MYRPFLVLLFRIRHMRHLCNQPIRVYIAYRFRSIPICGTGQLANYRKGERRRKVIEIIKPLKIKQKMIFVGHTISSNFLLCQNGICPKLWVNNGIEQAFALIRI